MQIASNDPDACRLIEFRDDGSCLVSALFSTAAGEAAAEAATVEGNVIFHPEVAQCVRFTNDPFIVATLDQATRKRPEPTEAWMTASEIAEFFGLKR